MSPNAKKLLNVLNPKKLIKPLRAHRDHDDVSDTVSNGTAPEDDNLSISGRLPELGADDLNPRTPSMRSEISQGGASIAEDLDGVLFEEGGEMEGVSGGVLSKDVLAPLNGGMLVDELYGVTAKELNRIIFGPGSKMSEEMRTRKGVTDPHTPPWAPSDEEGVVAERMLDYMTAPSKLVKSCRAVETQKYLAATSSCYVIHVTTVAKDVPMGDTFCTEVKFCITQEPPSGSTLTREGSGASIDAPPTPSGRFSRGSESPRTPRHAQTSPRTPKSSDANGAKSSSSLSRFGMTSPESVNGDENGMSARSLGAGDDSVRGAKVAGSEAGGEVSTEISAAGGSESTKSLASNGRNAVTRLQISYEPKFLKSTIMKGMIEKGMAQGLKETYATFVEILGGYAAHLDKDALAAGSTSKRLDGKGGRRKGGALELLPSDLSDDGQDIDAFLESVFDEVASGASILVLCLAAHRFADHIFGLHLYGGDERRGMVFWLGLHPAVRVWEVVWAGVIATLVLMMVSRGLDLLRHGISMVIGDNQAPNVNVNGWQLSVAILEAQNLPMVDENGLKRDPFVLLGCGGQSRTSSVKVQGQDTRWNEVHQFDPMDSCPRYLAIAVEDYEGPFSDAQTLGIAEVDFLKYTTEGLNDLWVYLEGEKVRGTGARLHLKIVLNNENASEAGTRTRELTEIVEQETGKKIKAEKSQYSGPFHRLFSLPEHEILIDNFACQLKRKRGPNAGGRIYLSPNLLAFYSNHFGTKISFTLAWEDIEEIKERTTPKALMALQTILFPHVKIYLKASATPEAIKHATSLDKAGRHVFRFENFVHPGNAFRTMRLLHKQHGKVERDREEMREVSSTVLDEEEFLAMEEPEMTLALEMDVPITPEAFLEIMYDNQLDQQVASALGWQDYSATEWTPVEDAEERGAMRRQVSYRYPHRQRNNAELRAVVLQQRWAEPDLHQIGLNEITTLHGAAFGDHFQVQGRKVMTQKDSQSSTLQSFVGVTFHKETAFRDKIVKSVLDAAKRDAREHGEVLAAVVMATVQGMQRRA